MPSTVYDKSVYTVRVRLSGVDLLPSTSVMSPDCAVADVERFSYLNRRVARVACLFGEGIDDALLRREFRVSLFQGVVVCLDHVESALNVGSLGVEQQRRVVRLSQ